MASSDSAFGGAEKPKTKATTTKKTVKSKNISKFIRKLGADLFRGDHSKILIHFLVKNVVVSNETDLAELVKKVRGAMEA